MIIGEVRTFPNVKADKEQVLKILEEAAEVYSAWESWEEFENPSLKWSYVACSKYRDLLSECADVIQATCNLMSALGVEDATYQMEQCEKRNAKRGRYDIQESA